MRVLLVSCLALLLSQPPPPPAPSPAAPPDRLPRAAAEQLTRGFEAVRPHKRHVWRDTVALHADGTVTAYIEIPRGERQKWEFSLEHNRRMLDRVLPREAGVYPVNYGFVPQTISYDGDPFDALVLGRALRGGALVRGAIAGIMYMEDEKGLDSKVVLSPVMMGKPVYPFTDADRARIGQFFAKYKDHEPGKFSRVTGWGSAEEGLAYVRQTHEFFKNSPP